MYPKKMNRKKLRKVSSKLPGYGPKKSSKNPQAQAKSRSWDAVANWYAGWSGPQGSRHHKLVAMPTVIELLNPREGEKVLDIGCGAGALFSTKIKKIVCYQGIDNSRRLIDIAKRHFQKTAKFQVGDATDLAKTTDLTRGTFDAVIFLLSLQDISPLQDAINNAAWALKSRGRLVILMTHPCFRIPRQSGWGWDDNRKLHFRRVDRYLTCLDVPMEEYGGKDYGVTRSYHRPLETYVQSLFNAGFTIERLVEKPGPPPEKPHMETKAERRAREDIPLFLGIKAVLCK